MMLTARSARAGGLAATTHSLPIFILEWRTLTDVLRTDFRQDVMDLYSLFPHEMRKWLETAVKEAEAQGGKTAPKPKAA